MSEKEIPRNDSHRKANAVTTASAYLMALFDVEAGLSVSVTIS